MEAVLRFILMIASGGFVVSFAGVIVLSGMLKFCFDEEKMKWDATNARFWAVSRITQRPDVFTPLGIQLWMFRHLFVKTFVIAVGILIGVAVAAAIAEVNLGSVT